MKINWGLAIINMGVILVICAFVFVIPIFAAIGFTMVGFGLVKLNKYLKRKNEEEAK